jgi:hypothetical protein
MCKALDMLALMAPKAVIWACMHKLTMLIFGVLRSGLPFDRRTVAVSHIVNVAA